MTRTAMLTGVLYFFILSYYFTLLFLLFLCFSRPYITYMRFLDVKPLSLTQHIYTIYELYILILLK